MAIFFDACLNGAAWRFRLWDTQTGTYATDSLSFGKIVSAAKRLLTEGGALETPDTTFVVLKWLELAMERGTNDPSKGPVEITKRTWRTTNDPDPPAGPIRTALRARLLSEQAVWAILEKRLSEWTDVLSPRARAFLDETFVLRELLRGKGTATVRAEQRDDTLVRTRSIVAEIADKWHDSVSVETVDFEPATFLFRLR